MPDMFPDWKTELTYDRTVHTVFTIIVIDN